MEDKNAVKLPEKRQAATPDVSSSTLTSTSAMSSVIEQQRLTELMEDLTTKRQRMTWSTEIREKFESAVDKLGGIMNATPKGIMKLMGEEGVAFSYDSVAYHLQKYRGHKGRSMQAASSNSSLQSAAKPAMEDEDSPQVFDEMPERTLFDVRPIKKLVAATLAIIFISRVCKRMALSSFKGKRRLKKSASKILMIKKSASKKRPSKILMINNTINPPLPFDGSIGDDALLYCALFPPDYEFDKDTLVQLWMAVGFFVEEPMERFAGLFFENFLTKGYLQFSRTNLLTGKAMYKFKGDSQLLPKLISSCSHIVRIEGSSNLGVIYPEVAHVSVRCSDLTDSFVLHDYQRFKHLQTLILLHGHRMSFKQVSRDFFVFLRQLWVLDLSKTHLMELPSSIGNLKCLCFLDLSGTLIKRLPEAIDCLEKLQTLKLRGCSNLSTLPKGMRKLVNLRHLDFDVFHQLRSMPEWMGYLINIRTLSAFLIGVEQGCSIRQLKNMNYLSGSFCISRLENVLTEDEAEEACLPLKTQIQKLELHWSDSQNEDAVGSEKIISSLQPTKSLEELNVSCYSGFELPSWICDPSFTKLVSITLFECENCLILPSLGQLPSLKYLNMVGFQKLKVIDHEFYGGSCIEGYIAFPKLEKLTIENMLSLGGWSGISSFEFPCLLNLTVKHCPKLHYLCTLSSLCSLEHLEISHCAMLASFSDDKLPARVNTFIIEDCPLISVRFLNGGEDWQRAAHIPHVWIDHKEISYG